MDELEFWTVIKYLDRLKQELQDEIVDTICHMGAAIVKAKKLEE